MDVKIYKQIAEEFLLLTSAGRSREAFQRFVGENFIHHNVYFRGDAQTLMVAMEQNAGMFPESIFEIKRLIAEGDLVACHSHYRQNQGDSGYAITHIFRFENEKIAEMWDFGQKVPDTAVNENGMF